jgi:hypothetical protein
MQEDDLVAEIRSLATDSARRTTTLQHRATWLQKYPGIIRCEPVSELPPPATANAVADAVRRLGFAFPPLLCRLWVEVANGGFGPGNGLFGLEGGHQSDAAHQTLPDLYLDAIDDPAWEDTFDEPWPQKLVPICDWGGLAESAVDCSTLEGEVIDLRDGWYRHPRGVTFARWMEQWVNGEEL